MSIRAMIGQPPGRVVVRPEADGHEAGSEGQGKSGGEKDFAYFVLILIPYESDFVQGGDSKPVSDGGDSSQNKWYFGDFYIIS